MSNFVSYDNATTLMGAIALKLQALGGAYIIKGNSAFASIPATPTAAQNGFVYNITDDFTTDVRFVEGAGKAYPAGTNIVIVNLGTAEVPNMKYDVLGTFVDVSALENAIQAAYDMIADEFDATQAYSTGDIVVYQATLYKFNTDHAIGDWDSSEADEVTITSLIQAAEPDSLTTAQVNTLIGLLN